MEMSKLRNNALVKIAYGQYQVGTPPSSLIPGYGRLIERGDHYEFAGRKYSTPAEADLARIRLRIIGAKARKANRAAIEQILKKKPTVPVKAVPGKFKGKGIAGLASMALGLGSALLNSSEGKPAQDTGAQQTAVGAAR